MNTPKEFVEIKDEEVLKLGVFVGCVGGLWSEIQERAKEILIASADPDFDFAFKTKIFVENLQSILDHLAFYLATQNKEEVYFPLRTNREDLRGTLIRYGIDLSFIDIFEKVQPYKTTYVKNICLLSNEYKHRFIKLLNFEERKVVNDEFYYAIGGDGTNTPIIIGAVSHRSNMMLGAGKFYFVERDLVFDIHQDGKVLSKITMFIDISSAYELINELITGVFVQKYGRAPVEYETGKYNRKSY